MRVLHVSDCYLPRLGGIELQVHDLATQQHRAGHAVRVVTRTPRSDHEDALATSRLGLREVAAAVPSDAFEGVDVVHCHTSIVSPLSWAYARAAARRGVPVVVTMHSIVQPSAVVRAGLRAVADALGPSVTWTAVSRVAADALRPLVPGPVTVLPNGIDPGPWRRLLPAPGEVPTLVGVMRLSARKRTLPLVDILADVRDRYDGSLPLRATIIGDGPQRDAAWRQLRRLGMQDWVHLPGRLNREEIAAELSRASMFLAPARLESFGIAPLEARCAGVPVLAMRGGGVEEFIRDGVEGRLVADDRDMATAALDLLTDPAGLARIRTHNATTPTDLDWAGVVDRTLTVYGHALTVERALSPTPLP